MADDYRFFERQVLLTKMEDVYGEDSNPSGAANAILALNVQLEPMSAEQIERKFYRREFGARPKVATGRHVRLSYEIEVAGSGAAGVAPAYGPILRMAGLAEVLTTGTATIAAAAAAGAGATGAFAYVRGQPYAGLWPRTVTLTCTTGGGSGVAAFTVSAPAVGTLAAYNQAGVVMTDGAAFPLPGGATVTPTVTADFVMGDSYTIALTPHRARYAPVSDGFESATQLINIDGTVHKMLGCRAEIGVKVMRKAFSVFTVQSYGLFVPITSGVLPTADFSGFRDPTEANQDTVPWFDFDGFEPALSELTVALGSAVGHRQVVNRQGIRISGRDATVNLTIDEPAFADKNYYALHGGAGVPLSIQHGTAAGGTVRVEMPSVQVQDLSVREDEKIKQLVIKGGVLPVAGNDEVAISVL